MIEQQTKKQIAHAKHIKITEAAWIEYKDVNQLSYDRKVKKTAYDKYKKIVDSSWAEYKKVKEE